MPEITTVEQFILRILKIVFWLLIVLPMILLPIFYFVYVLPVEFQCGFNLLTCSIKVNWNLALDMFNPAELNPFVSNSYISQLGLGANSPMFRAAVFPGLSFAAIVASYVIWGERKILAKMQYRVGPLYAGRVEGWLQSFADLFKLLFKEIVIPARADALMFLAPPFAMMVLSGALLGTIPIGSTVFISNSPFSLLIAIAILSFFPIVSLLAGWASNNKFSFIGAVRALYQMISYEIPLLLSVLGVVILTHSLSLYQIAESQTRIWYLGPMILGAIVFYITSMAEVERVPFDLPEADSELVAGWITEYTSMLFGVINLAVYIKLYALSSLFTLIFLGGWLGPAGIPDVAWFLIKTIIVLIIFIIPRGFFPRVRIDQLIDTGWLWLIGMSFVNIFFAFLLSASGVL
jgi:NADH-quinone oxidoreductase subunit H